MGLYSKYVPGDGACRDGSFLSKLSEAKHHVEVKVDMDELDLTSVEAKATYNKPKSPDSRQPGCPKEKVKAIEDAMRHFQMI